MTFEEATAVLQDPNAVELYDDAHSEDEGRFALIGFSEKVRLLYVPFTPRGKRLRIISARFATKREERIYDEDE